MRVLEFKVNLVNEQTVLLNTESSQKLSGPVNFIGVTSLGKGLLIEAQKMTAASPCEGDG